MSNSNQFLDGDAASPVHSEGLESLLKAFMSSQDARYEALSARVEQVFQQRQSIMDRLEAVADRRSALEAPLPDQTPARVIDHTPARISARARESFGGFAMPGSMSARSPGSALDGRHDTNFREPTLRLKVPELKIQKTYSYEDVLGFLDQCHGHMTAWEALPINKENNRRFPDANQFPISLIPMAAAEYICSLIGYIYSVNHCRLKTEAEVSKGKFWSTIDGDTLRTLIVKARVDNHCLTDNLDRLTKIRFNSAHPYNHIAWVEFNHDLNKEIRYSSEGDFEYSDVDLKDHIIRSFPDASFQKELYLCYGNRGVLKGRFQVGELLERIESRIKRFIKDNIATDQNRMLHQQLKAHNLTAEFPTAVSNDPMQPAISAPNHVHFAETTTQWATDRDDPDLQDLINAAMTGDKSCSRTGTGLDGLLNCRYLGKNGTCTFKHPEADMRLKGKGVTEKPSATMLPGTVLSSRPSKAFNTVDETFEA
jgi:hypothetical protein